MKFWLATFNSGKIKEFEAILKWPDKLIDLKFCLAKDVSGYYAPEETGTTFVENAKIKADSLFSVLDKKEIVIAEDSGLVVDGLNGYPGIFSARYAGDNASDVQNNAKLLKMVQIRCPIKREAKFVSCIYFKSPGLEFSVQGEVKGMIAKKSEGDKGFGYDPVFIPEGYEQTMAELGIAVKNKISHRNQAINLLKQKLEENNFFE